MSKFDIKILTEEVFEELELLAEEKNIRLKFKEGASIDTMFSLTGNIFVRYWLI
nr:hypothetical protein [Candidatus Brachybacter algidus]